MTWTQGSPCNSNLNVYLGFYRTVLNWAGYIYISTSKIRNARNLQADQDNRLSATIRNFKHVQIMTLHEVHWHWLRFSADVNLRQRCDFCDSYTVAKLRHGYKVCRLQNMIELCPYGINGTFYKPHRPILYILFRRYFERRSPKDEAVRVI